MKALEKWSEIIIGDLPPVPSRQVKKLDLCAEPYPMTIDDVHICGRDEVIDGPGLVLGSATPLWGRRDGNTGLWTTITGTMNFDIADIEVMVEDGTWETVVAHEIGHVIGCEFLSCLLLLSSAL